jgi:hypothetical protein
VLLAQQAASRILPEYRVLAISPVNYWYPGRRFQPEIQRGIGRCYERSSISRMWVLWDARYLRRLRLSWASASLFMGPAKSHHPNIRVNWTSEMRGSRPWLEHRLHLVNSGNYWRECRLSYPSRRGRWGSWVSIPSVRIESIRGIAHRGLASHMALSLIGMRP